MFGPAGLPPGPPRCAPAADVAGATETTEPPADTGTAAALVLRLLGPVECTHELPAGKPVVLLAALAAYAGEVIGVERLAGYVWPDSPPANQRATLQTYVMRLRRALGDAAVVTVGGGYLLGIPAGDTDIGRFADLLAGAAAHRMEGRIDAERSLLGAAMDLWRGQPFVDLDAPRLRAEVGAGLTEAWADAFERAVTIDLGRGQVDGLVARLRAAVERFPMRESLWVLLLRALRDTNRRAEAVTEYHRVRTLLDSELGVLPGPGLAAVYQELLVEPDAREPPWPVTTAHQLPRVLPDFVGRTAELDTVATVLDTGATVVVLWGMTGIGTSALAFSAAHAVRERYPDGQWYVSLGGGSPNPLPLRDAVAELLTSGGVDAAAIPPSATARAGLFRSLTAGRRVLLLLDNVGDLGQILPLIPGTPDSLVLITSRGALPALAGAHRVHLAPLPEDDAVAMLGTVLGRSRVRDEPEAAREIARLCGGLPVALRALGTRFGPLPEVRLATVAARLRPASARLDELSVGDRGVRPGLALSRAALDPAARAALARMAVLPRTFPAWALGALTDDSDGARLVESLVAAGLLDVTGTDRTGALTYRPHELVACYAAELLENTDPAVLREGARRLAERALARCTEHYAYPDIAGGWLPPDLPPGFALTAETTGADPDAWLRAHGDLVLATLAVACRFGWCAVAAVLADLVLPTMADSGRAHAVVDAAAALRDAATERGAERLAVRAQYLIGRALVWRDPERAVEQFRGCVDGFAAIGSEYERILAAVAHACARAIVGVPAADLAAQTVRDARALDDADDYLVAFTLHCQGFVLTYEQRPREAVPAFEAALERAGRHGNPVVLQRIYRRLAVCQLRLGELDAAVAAMRSARALPTSPRNRCTDGGMHYAEARLMLALGESEPCVRHARQAVRAAWDARFPNWWPRLVILLADAHRAAGRPGVADGLLARLLPDATESDPGIFPG